MFAAGSPVLFLKATITTYITVPGYHRADGTYVPPHQKKVHVDPGKKKADVLSGNGSHSQKKAHAKLSKLDHWHLLPEEEQHAHILSSATNIQNKASASAAVSGWKAAMLGGKKPSAAQQSAFDALPEAKKAELLAAVGKPAAPAPADQTPIKNAEPEDAGPIPGSHFTEDVNAVPMLHSTTAEAAAKIAESGFLPSSNSMYGKGVYFSSADLSAAGYGDKAIAVKLKPHKQLVLDSDTDVPAAFAALTGMPLGQLGSEKGMHALAHEAGVGSMRFSVDGQTYTVVFDPSLIDQEPVKNANPETSGASGDTPATEPWPVKTFAHSKKGHTVFAVPIPHSLSDDEYKAVAALAKEHGGFYSSYAKDGAIKGFHFKTAEAAAAFGAAAAGAPAPDQEPAVELSGDKAGAAHLVDDHWGVLSAVPPEAVDGALQGLADSMGYDVADLKAAYLAKKPAAPATDLSPPTQAEVEAWMLNSDPFAAASAGEKTDGLMVSHILDDAEDLTHDDVAKVAAKFSALAKVGKSKKPVAFRGMSLSADELVKMSAPGNVMTLDKLTSFTGSQSMALNYASKNAKGGKAPVVLSVKSEGGVRGLPLTDQDGNELELVAAPGFQYRTVSSVVAGGVTHITLEQIADAAQPSADGPKEGDTKQKDGKTYVLKNGRWRLQASEQEVAEDKADLADALLTGDQSKASELVSKLHEVEHGHEADVIKLGSPAKPDGIHATGAAFLVLQGKPAYDHIAQAKSAFPAAEDWLAANPGKEDELSSALVDLGYLNVAKVMGIYKNPGQIMDELNAKHGAGKEAVDKLLAGEGSHYHVKAAKKLHKDGALDGLHGTIAHEKVLALAAEMQADASLSAAFSGWKKKAAAGKNPSPAEWKAFYAQPNEKKAAALSDVHSVVGNTNHLIAPSVELPADSPKAAAPAATANPDKDVMEAIDTLAEAYAKGDTDALNIVINANVPGSPVFEYASKKKAEADALNPAPAQKDNDWTFTASNPGFSGAPSLEIEAADGSYFYVAYSDEDGTYEVGKHNLNEIASEPEFHHTGDIYEVSAKLVALGMDPVDTPTVGALMELYQTATGKASLPAKAEPAKPAAPAKVPAAVKKLQAIDPAAVEKWLTEPAGKKSPESMAFFEHLTKPAHTKFIKWMNANAYGDWKDANKGAALASLYGHYDEVLLKDGTWVPRKGLTIGQVGSPGIVTDAATVQAAVIAEKLGQPSPLAASGGADKDDQEALIAGWQQAMWHGQVPTKAQAEAVDALPEDEKMDAFYEQYANHTEEVDFDGGDSAAIEDAQLAAQEKVHALHNAALGNGPKDGDTKPAADGGTLVFRDGHWHKVKEPNKAKVMTDDDLKKIGTVANNKHSKAAKAAAKKGDAEGVKAAYFAAKADPGFPKTATWISKLATAMGVPLVPSAAAPAAPAPASSAPASKTYQFHNTTDGHFKFWNVTVEGSKVTTHYGKIGSAGTKTEKDLGTPAAAWKHASGLMSQKTAKGYVKTGDYEITPPAGGDAVEPAAPKAAAAPVKAKKKKGVSMDGWIQTGPQKGSNPGGKFKDKNGVEWYVKFPESEDVARNELLASKLYQMLGVAAPTLKLVEKDGTVGIASKWIDGLSKADAANLGKAPGTKSAFAIDAFLANWDVVGLSNDNLMLNESGRAVRVDVGGSLIYRAQGGLKGDAFGTDVPELDSLLDASKNDKSAAVFNGIKKEDMDFGLNQIAKLKPSQIDELCRMIGPGTMAEKVALADKLKARRLSILQKFGLTDPWNKPPVDEAALSIDAALLPKPIDFKAMNGGKGLSSKAWLNEQNTADSAALIAFAAKGNLTALKSYQYDVVDKETGALKGKASITDHPSQHVKQQWMDLVELLTSIAYPPVDSLPMPSMGFAESIGEMSDAVGFFKPSSTVETITAEHRMGFFMKLGQIDGIEDVVKETKWSWVLGKGSSSPKDAAAKFVSDAKAKFGKLSGAVRAYISEVQATGWINHIWSHGKAHVDASGNGGSYSGGIQSLSAKVYQEAEEIPEGTQVWRWMNDTTANQTMMKQLLEAKPGLVIQNTDSMCCSYNEAWGDSPHFGSDVLMRIRCPKGAKGTLSFASGKFGKEHEITTLPGARFVIVSTKKGIPGNSNGVMLDVVMLPPHDGYVAELGKMQALGKSLVFFVRSSHVGKSEF